MNSTKTVFAALFLVLTTLSGSARASPPVFVTTFNVAAITHFEGDDAGSDLRTNYNPQDTILLPYDFDKWSCQIITLPKANDRAYENVVCIHEDVSVGMSVSCPVTAEGSDANLFFIQFGHTTVSFNGTCATHLR